MVTANSTNRLTDTQKRLCEYIQENLDAELLRTLKDKIFDRYVGDSALSLEHFPSTGTYVKPHLHRYGTDEVFVDLFGEEVVRLTSPRGGMYTMFSQGDLSLSHYELQPNQKLRPAAHRKLIVKKNKTIEPYQSDWIDAEEVKEVAIHKIHAAIIIEHVSTSPEESVLPSEIYLEVPYSDWTGSHLVLKLSELIELNEELEVDLTPDIARSTLKDDLLKIEREDKDHG